MKIAFWVMFCVSVMSCSRALDCEDSACLNTLSPLMKSPNRGQNLFKCPHDNYCVELWSDGDETYACEYCPQGGNEKMCREVCSSNPDYTPCDSNVTKCLANAVSDNHCDGVDNCPDKSDEKKCSNNNNPACKGQILVNYCAQFCPS